MTTERRRNTLEIWRHMLLLQVKLISKQVEAKLGPAQPALGLSLKKFESNNANSGFTKI